MTERISIRDKIIKLFRKNETAGNIYIHFIKNKPEHTKNDAIKIFLEIASLENKDLYLRAKAIAILCFLGDMCCMKDVDEYYKDGRTVCNFKNEISQILESNFIELAEKLQTIGFKEVNNEIIPQLLHSIITFSITSKSASTLVKLLDRKLKLTENYKKNKLDMKYLNLYEQIEKIKKKM